MTTEQISVRIDSATKKTVEKIFSRIGLSPTDAVRMFYHQVKEHRGLPFPARIPNAETIAAIEEARSGKGKKHTWEDYKAYMDFIMKSVVETGAYRRDFKYALKRGKNASKLFAIITCLAAGNPLPLRCRPHPLKGKWYPCMECHIEPDWLLIYETNDDTLLLVRTGTHSDLFD